MRDYYKELGLKAEATVEEIKKAYRKQALHNHPDKMGGNDERMKLINEAYQILINPEKRKQFDDMKDFFCDEDDEINQQFLERLNVSGIPYSQEFRERHKYWVQIFTRNPLPRKLARECFSSYKSKVDLMDSLKLLFSGFIKEHKATGSLLAYIEKGIYDINFFREFTQYIGGCSPLSVQLINLFQNQCFRDLFKIALQDYWQDKSFGLDKKVIDTFDGKDKTQKFCENLKENISNKQTTGQISLAMKNLVQCSKLLVQFENSMHIKNIPDQKVEEKQEIAVPQTSSWVEIFLGSMLTTSDSALQADYPLKQNAEDYREIAYYILDWVPAFSGKMPTAMLTNLVRQAGFYFQLAAQAEKKASFQMADEKIALQLYLITFGVGHHTTPDIELYNLIHGLRFIACFQFADEEVAELIKAFQYQALLLADMFPFYQPLQPNIDFLVEENKLLELMRRHLHGLIMLISSNQKNLAQVTLDVPEAMVLYRAYEATIKRWYEQPYRAETESALKLKLMETLLADYGWDFTDIEENVALSKSSIKRNDLSWIEPISVWTESASDVSSLFRSVNGVTVDYKKGEIKLLAIPCDRETPDCFRSLTMMDIAEMIRNNITGAIFSLDPADKDMEYHPFNSMRFAPTRLYQSRFLETLLSTDYLLKFLTIGQEVQGIYPFATRSIDSLIRYLPEYLRLIIENFHKAQHSESLHRFWIEADYIPAAFDESKLQKDAVENIHLYDVKMRVKKQLMTRDPHGKLVDKNEVHEGWFFYVLSTQLKKSLDEGVDFIKEPAMLFLMAGYQVFFVENNKKSSFTLKNYTDPLEELRSCKRDQTGLVIEDEYSKELIYRITREVERQSAKPNKFTPEYIFAQEFTQYYEEFSLYFPEFKRLQELSRLVVLVQLLNGIRQSNKEVITKLNQELSYIQQWKDRSWKELSLDNPYQKEYDQALKQCSQSTQSIFIKCKGELDYSTVLAQKKYSLREMREKIGSLSLSAYSKEVDEVCQNMHDDAVSRYGYGVSYQIQSQINGERSKIAQELSSQKKSDCQQQLYNLFSSIVSSNTVINRFLEHEEIDPLANELTKYEISKGKKQLGEAVNASLEEIENALRGCSSTILTIATRVADKQFSELLEQKRKLLQEQKKSREHLEREITVMGLGANEKEVNLLGLCLWVPSSINHNVSVANNPARFVYGGVAVQPRIAQTNQIFSNPNARGISSQQVSGVGGGSSNGGNGGNSGSGGFGGNGRFTMIATGVSKIEAQNILLQGNHDLTQGQVKKVIETLGKGRMDNVSIKHVNHNSEVRVFGVRSGHTDGYQRMSYGIDVSGQRTLIVQTAFDNHGNLVHQKSGQAKNNLYDVKYPK